MATGNNRESTFGRDLMKFISSNMPYSSYSVLDKISEFNPKFELFFNKNSKYQENLINKSVSAAVTFDDPAANIHRNREFSDFMYANIQPDKGKRLGEYRVMAAFPKVADALDEICDEAINTDGDGNVAKLVIKEGKLKAEIKDAIQNEFKRYIGFYKLPNNGWDYVRQLVTDAEVYFEHIIHKDHPKEGVLGVLLIPSDVIDPIFSNVQNTLVKGYMLRKPIFDSRNPNKIKEIQMVPMESSQVVYVNSGIWNENKTVRIPFIENARRSYRQLSLIEDAIVIYRLVRSSDKLVFNVDVGNLAPAKAEAYLRKLMTQYWSKRTFDADQGSTVNKFTPQSMLDSFWFAKRAGSEGTSVTQLAAGANLGELSDLNYFLKDLYRSLKVPTTRTSPDDVFQDGEGILREELKFARSIIRLQQRFAEGIKLGFISHLKLRELWSEFDLKESSFELIFNVPTNFYELRESQKLQLRFETFNNITQNEMVSKTFAQKKYLGWGDHDILANREFMRKDAEFTWEVDQIRSQGPNWRANLGQPNGQPGESPAGPGGMPAFGGAPAGGGSALPPEFGPAPSGGAAEGGAVGGGTQGTNQPTGNTSGGTNPTGQL